MKNILFFLTLVLMVTACSRAQDVNYKSQAFKSFCEGFQDIVPVSCIDQNVYLDEIPDDCSKKYLGLSDKDLMIDDGDYDYDDDVWSSNWRKREPLYVGKIELDKCVVLVYKYLDNINEIGENWISILLSLDYDGTIKDKKEVSGYKTLEDDNMDCVFVDKHTFRFFEYKKNTSYTAKRNGGENSIHEDVPLTICVVTEYRITDGGKIETTGWTDTKFLKESVTFYRERQKDSDDPKNEYK